MTGPTPTSTNGAGPETLDDAPVAPEAARGVCPYFHEAVELVGKRWNGAIVHALLSGPMRFSALAHAVPQISDRLLSMRLRELESNGIVTRQVHDGAPVRVEYELTEKGRALEPTVRALREWAREWVQDPRHGQPHVRQPQ